MIYGYCRISTKKQSIERQIRNILSAYPTVLIKQEIFTGRKTIGRKMWQWLLDHVTTGDTIVFDSVSRMSRNAEEGIRSYEELMGKGIELVFLKEPYINTSTYRKAKENSIPMTGTAVDLILDGINKYLQVLAREQITIAFEQAQKEVDDLSQRTKEGLITAKREGKQIGQVAGKKLNVKKSIEAKNKIRIHSSTFGGTLTDAECISLTGISRNTFYKYKKELIEELKDKD